MKEYLKKQGFEKYFKKLYKKLEKKTVVIYGTGKLFQQVAQDYNLKNLNIIGITDRKYLLEDEGKSEFGYKIIPYAKLHKIEADSVIIATQKYLSLEKSLKKIFPAKIIMPLVKFSIKEQTSILLNKISFIKKFRQSKNNTIVLIKANGKKIYSPKIKNFETKFSGKNNYIEIHEPIDIEQRIYISGDSDNKVVIYPNNEHRYLKVLMGNKNTLTIGRNTSSVNLAIHMFSGENKSVTIGDDCQFSWDIMLRTTDAHTVYNIKTREVINPAKDIFIGDHVWICANTTVLKGSKIASNCMVGTGSIINKEFNDENCMIAGAPAKVIKRDINWDRRGVSDFSH